MSNSTTNIKEIEKLVVLGLIWGYLPTYILALGEPFVKDIPGFEAIAILLRIFIFFFFLYSYAILANAANKYAQYKGYKNYFYIYSILNIFGLSILCLLKNKNSNNNISEEPLKEFSLLSILAGYGAISILLTPLFILTALWIRGADGLGEYIQNNEDFLVISNVVILILYIWYLIREFKRYNLDYKLIFGSLKKIDFKLPLGLAITDYVFVCGINPPILYGLSFIFPQYVEYLINKEYASTFIGWLCFAISALLFAPVIEELIFRGLILQKVAVVQNINKALLISAFGFAIVHFRFDLVSLFVGAIVLAILYLKTKQLAYPILCHFFYNLIAVARNIYTQYFSNNDPNLKLTVVEYRQQFIDDWKWCVLFFALSTPYLCYFIYKNYPRNYSIQKLPYYANQQNNN